MARHPTVSASPELYPIGAAATLDELSSDPYALLARLRMHEPVSWISVLDGWLVTRHELALAVMHDAATFTVEDERFTTARVVGPSMLSLDGDAHARHRAPFVVPFRPTPVRERFGGTAAAEAERLLAGCAGAEAERLVSGQGEEGLRVELRRSFAGPISAFIVARALGLDGTEVRELLTWYEAIVAGVTALTAGEPLPASATAAFASLSERLLRAAGGDPNASLLAGAAANGALTPEEVASNAAVLLFGGIETTEGMIANVVLALLEHPSALARVREDEQLLDAAIDESLRLEPAAAVIDRYATRDAEIGGAQIRAGELVRVSITAANRDPEVFSEPDVFQLERANVRRHLAFAHGPHVCLGIHLARLEAREALAALLALAPGLRLDPDRPAVARGLVFRKPPELNVLF
jgi:cytochrome P450